ncbi:tRNA lysidine(34) synthetase TilS [Enterovibrio sp. ZSDZ35]|uniref:tRNA(Ile)-lysidine synthase n=1 Tax=Enterovibrio qingdaonensis TaxID=2899818 RepID=A0ABT5QRX9_9GAMM|nr:tRNA lysidine(34) synthetase TilS [Enterovibrio sp. ZSDZ35]MDD1783747.1 tRNA lysidine(34) synthetase TilS [Enterovibrio sp. ZSDZ35]
MLFPLFEKSLCVHTASPRQIVLAFSGGVDSRVMLDLLAQYRNKHPQHRYLAIHIHHGLSGNADVWLAQCEGWAKAVEIPFKGIRVSLDSQGESLEKVAREARYKAIVSNVEPGALILAAQHADDQAETFLLALKRGSGPAGLASMPALREMGHAQLLRPLLSASRDQIESYASDKELSWVEDESNRDNRFDRNFIRNEWLPSAKARWPGITKAINRTAQLCAEQEALLDILLKDFDQDVVNSNGSLSIERLTQLETAIQTAVVRRWFKRQTASVPSLAQLREVFSGVIDAAEDANPKLKIGQWWVHRHGAAIYIVKPTSDVTYWVQEVDLDVTCKLPDGLGIIYLSTVISGSGQRLRAPEKDEVVRVQFNPEGLLAHPIGRQGKRKLKKLFQEYRVPTWERRRTPLVFYGKQLVAVAGLFVCEGFEGQECELLWNKFHALDA